MTNDTQADPAAQAAPETPPEAPKAPPKPKGEQRNGITRPADPGSLTGQVWSKADELSRMLKAPVPRADVMKALDGIVNPATIATQYGRWREFNGLKGQKIVATREPKPPKEPKAPKEKKVKAKTAPEEPVIETPADAAAEQTAAV